MIATPALVRPRFTSDLDPLASLWIVRLCAGFTAACSQIYNGMYSEETRQMIGIEPGQEQCQVTKVDLVTDKPIQMHL